MYLFFLFKEFWVLGFFQKSVSGLGFLFCFSGIHDTGIIFFKVFATNTFYKGREVRFSGDSHLILGLDCLITKQHLI